MEKSFDLKIIEFKERLVEAINEAQLPLTCVHYALVETAQLVASTLESQLRKEREEIEAANKAEKADEKEGA